MLRIHSIFWYSWRVILLTLKSFFTFVYLWCTHNQSINQSTFLNSCIIFWHANEDFWLQQESSLKSWTSFLLLCLNEVWSDPTCGENFPQCFRSWFFFFEVKFRKFFPVCSQLEVWIQTFIFYLIFSLLYWIFSFNELMVERKFIRHIRLMVIFRKYHVNCLKWLHV